MDSIASDGRGATAGGEKNGKFPHYPDGFPDELKHGPWVACNENKAPKIATTSGTRAASSTDPETWRSYEEALEAYKTGRFAGIGRVLTKPYAGIDIDDCRDPETGVISPDAWDIVRFFDSYTEVSPSGTGVKIWIRADLDYTRTRKDDPNGLPDLEVYHPRGRFFTITGQMLDHVSGDVEDRQDELEAFMAKEFPEPERKRKKYDGNGFDKDFDLASWLEFHGVEILGYSPDDRGGVYSIVCPWAGEHTGGDISGTRIGRADVNGGTWFHCHHAHCAERDYFDFRDKLAPRAKVRPPRGGIGPGHTNSSDSSDSFFQVIEETPPFPVDAMPVKTRAFIRETAAAIDCPAELVALPVIATLSAALGHAREVEVKRGHEQSAAIYALGVADSGSGKSPAASKAQRPLKMIQSENNKKYKENLKIYEQQMRVHVAEAKRARKNDEPEPEPPPKPLFKRTWVENITIEALAPKLEQNPYGLGLFHDELTGWIRGFDQYKSGGKGDTRQQYLKIWSNDSIAIDRKADDETIILERPYLTVYGTIQPRLIEDMGVEREDGFINRFLMAYPGPHIARENDEEISYQAEISYEELVKELYRLRPRGLEEKSTLLVNFNRSARELYKEHSNRLADNAGNPATPRGLRDTYPKLRAYLARLSLLMATCREIETGGDTEITRRDVETAAALMEYFEGVAKKVHHEIASSDTETRIAFEIFSLLNRAGGHKTATADEFRRALPLAPDTPEATSKLLRKIVKKHPELILEDGWRGKERVLKISLLEKTVGTVGTVGRESDYSEPPPAEEPPHEPEPDPDAKCKHEYPGGKGCYLCDPERREIKI